MKKLILTAAALLALTGPRAGAETFTLETTYPSPLGAYDKVDSGQLRFNGYTQEEIDAGAVLSEKERKSGKPPEPGRVFYNKDSGYLYITAMDPDPNDKSTWYIKLAYDLSEMDIYVKGEGTCVLYNGAQSGEYKATQAAVAAKTAKICGSNSFLDYKNPPEIGKVYGRMYLEPKKAFPRSRKRWKFSAKCKVALTGLNLPKPKSGSPETLIRRKLTKDDVPEDVPYPLTAAKFTELSNAMPYNRIALYKQVKKVLAVKAPAKDGAPVIVYEPLTSEDTLLFNFGNFLYTYNLGNVVNMPRRYVAFNKGGGGYTYEYSMEGEGDLPASAAYLRLRVQAHYPYLYVKTPEATFAGDTQSFVYYISNPDAKPPTAQAFAALSSAHFTHTLTCEDVIGGIPTN